MRSPEVTGSVAIRPSRPLRARIRWLLLARVVIVTVFLGAVALTHAGADSDPDFPLREVAALIVVAYLFSLLSVSVLERISQLTGFAYFQISADVLLISLAVVLTGGLQSPMAVWYNLAVIGAAILLFRRGAFLTAALSSLIYGGIMSLAYEGVLPIAALYVASGGAEALGFGVFYQVAANIASFFSIALLSSILVERLARTEQALEVSEATRHRIETLQRTLVQNLESGILTTDPTGRIESANPAIRTVLGKDPAALIGRSIMEIFPVLRPPVGSRRILGPTPIPTELTYQSESQGGRRELRCTSAPLADTYENPIGTLFILQDVTSIASSSAEAEAVVTTGPGPGPVPVRSIDGLIGLSPALAEVVQMIHRVAPTDSTVLITGESGTGKELAARAIHSLSSRRSKSMVVVNCAAIPENLIESELFGHVRGAYTGAVSDRRGLFRAADEGTIFLDEIGDLPLPLQVKLLRVLQERSFTPVGGQSQVAVDVRIIAATNRDLEAEVAAGRFRDDLFYRLNVIRIEMPPLRDRKEDLPALIRHFIDRFSEVLKKPGLKISPAAMNRMLSYPFPGNIRQLENVIEHAVALCGPDGIGEEDLPPKLLNGTAGGPRVPGEEPPSRTAIDLMRAKGSNLDAEIEEYERRFIEEALRQAGGVRKRAAEILGINYRSLRHRLSKYGFGESDRGSSD